MLEEATDTNSVLSLHMILQLRGGHGTFRLQAQAGQGREGAVAMARCCMLTWHIAFVV